MKFENLLTSQLAGVEGTEVVVSVVTVPANTTLPEHWHPGEEFAYVMEGSVTLIQQGHPDVVCKKGDAAVVPLKQVHTIRTENESCSMVVFRVHEQGEPERILLDAAV